MSPKELFGFVLVAAVSGASGWLLSGRWHDARVGDTSRAIQFASRQMAESAAAQGAALVPIQVHPDGRMSLHLDHAPLDWVLQELQQRQPRHPAPLATGADVASGTKPVDCEAADPAEPAPKEQAALLRNLRQGSDAERQAALVRASEAGLELPPKLLLQLLESDPSEAVRLLAFMAYLDAVADDPDALRAALEIGSYSHSPAVQEEARRRATEWTASLEDAGVTAAAPQGTR